jgi:WD40 repeat protein
MARFICLAVFLFLWLVSGSEQCGAKEAPISYTRQIAPIFKRNCNGCHYPGKLKGELDLTTYPAILKGGKHGASIKVGDPKTGTLMEELSGEEPSMPKEGDPLSKAELALIEKWIKQGAPNDTPKVAESLIPSAPPKYRTLPVVSALAYSADGKLLAVSGFHEVLLYDSENMEVKGRLLGEASRVESIVFSPDGKQLAVAANAPGVFGQVQIWNVDGTNLVKAFKVSNDSIYGLSWSPQGDRVAVGCADRTSRVFGIRDGKELAKFENHSDWVFGTAFALDGKRYVSASRDKSMKLVDATNGQYVDDLNRQTEPILCLARHPSEDMVAFGSDQGMIRVYKIAENPNRSAEGKEPAFIKETERISGPAHVVAFSPDGNLLGAAGSANEIKVYSTKDWKRVSTLKGFEGAIFALAFHPKTNHVGVGGFDGKIRIYETAKGQLVKTMDSVPLEKASQTASR